MEGPLPFYAVVVASWLLAAGGHDVSSMIFGVVGMTVLVVVDAWLERR